MPPRACAVSFRALPPGDVTQPAQAHRLWFGNGKETEYFIRIGSVALADE